MRRTLAAVGVVMIATVAACGDETAGSGSPVEYTSVAELVEASTAASLEHETAHLVVTGTDPSLGGQDMTGQMRFGDDHTDLSLIADNEVGGIVMLDGIVYLKSADEMVPGKPWVRVDPEQELEGMGALLRIFARQMVQSSDPARSLEEHQSAAEITTAEAEDVDSTQTMRYDIEVDLKALLDTVEGMDRLLIQTSIDLGIDTVAYSMWLDGRDLPLRITTESASPQGNMVESTLTYSDWGESVEIGEPPAAETADASEIETPDMSELSS